MCCLTFKFTLISITLMFLTTNTFASTNCSIKISNYSKNSYTIMVTHDSKGNNGTEYDDNPNNATPVKLRYHFDNNINILEAKQGKKIAKTYFYFDDDGKGDHEDNATINMKFNNIPVKILCTHLWRVKKYSIRKQAVKI